MDLPAVHDYDVIIIGGGLTGLRAALQVSSAGLSCAVLSKVHPLRSHSVAAQGGMNAPLGNVPGEDGSADSWEHHAYDTVKGSDYLADQDAVVLMCREAAATVFELEHMGTVWSRLGDGRIAQRPFGGAGFPRTCYAADRTGHNMLNTLYEQVTARKIPVFEEFFVTSLVTDGGRCTGCTALAIMTGAVHGFSARAILVATGGFGRIFSRSTNALINTGDGTALALLAGARLKDMEFVQFHPTTLRGSSILISEAARGEGGFLVNNAGERFMERYAPLSLELAGAPQSAGPGLFRLPLTIRSGSRATGLFLEGPGRSAIKRPKCSRPVRHYAGRCPACRRQSRLFGCHRACELRRRTERRSTALGGW